MKQTFSGADLRQHNRGGVPQGMEREDFSPTPAKRGGFFKRLLVGLVLAVIVVGVIKGVMYFFLVGEEGGKAQTEAQEAGKVQEAAVEKHELTPTAMAQVVAYLSPSSADMEPLFEYVRSSSHIKQNAKYAETMGAVTFVYDDDRNVVNAFASVNKKIGPCVCLLGGAARFARTAALAVAANVNGDDGAGARFIAALKPKDLAAFDLNVMKRIIKEANLENALADEKTLLTAKSVSAGLILGILAHEAGHQALGHVNQNPGVVNFEISRNQEREADSFASSVISSSDFGQYILTGTLFWHYALAQQQDDDVVSTHPHSKERFKNFVRDNPTIAKAMGLDIETIEKEM